MSCSTCAKVVEPLPDNPGLEYSLASNLSVQGRDGKFYKINSCLIPTPYKPTGGWGVVFNIKGQRITVTGQTPREVFLNSKKVFALNGLVVTDRDVWVNLNIQWTQRTITKRQNILLDDLLALAGVNADLQQSIHEVQRWSASEWSAKIWGMPETYLAQSVYEYPKFLGMVQVIREFFDKTTNPQIGNTLCYIEASKRTTKLVSEPIYVQATAREFLWALKTAINLLLNIPTKTLEETAEENHWL